MKPANGSDEPDLPDAISGSAADSYECGHGDADSENRLDPVGETREPVDRLATRHILVPEQDFPFDPAK